MRHWRVFPSASAGLAALVLAAPPAAHAQVSPDSVSILREEVQRIFSRVVYWPREAGASAITQCQVRKANFCAGEHNLRRYIDRASTPPPAVYDPEYDQNRFLDLVEKVETMVDTLPDNGWFAGQLVFLRILEESYDAAVALAQRCSGTRWWCDALKGFATHAAWRYREADSLFAAALAGMPAETRCRWRDVSMLLDDSTRAVYAGMPCGGREDFEEILWWLSDPLFMLTANDRRTEHYSRRVLDSLLTGAATAFSGPNTLSYWDSDFSDLLMRYGLAAHWLSSVRWVHYHTPHYHFVPVRPPLSGDLVITPENWNLRTPLEMVPERYHPGYEYVHELTQAQVVAFPRGDSMLVAAALGLGMEPIVELEPFIAMLNLSRSPFERPQARFTGDLQNTARFLMSSARRNVLVGLEVMAQEHHLAGRLRFTLEAPPRDTAPSISSLLMFEPDGTPLSTLAETAPRMLGSSIVDRDEPLGIFWEMYGFHRDSSATLTVAVTPARDPGLFARIGRALRIVNVPGTILVSWNEARLRVGEGAGQSVSLDISTLAPGDYTLSLEIVSADGSRARSSRLIQVVRDREPLRDMREALGQKVPGAGLGEMIMPPVRQRDTPLRVIRGG